MKREYKIAIVVISIALILITILFLNYSREPIIISSNGFTVKPEGDYIIISGNVDFKTTSDSADYKFTPDSGEMYKIEKTGQNKIALKDHWKLQYTNILRSNLDGKNIRVHGYLWQIF